MAQAWRFMTRVSHAGTPSRNYPSFAARRVAAHPPFTGCQRCLSTNANDLIRQAGLAKWQPTAPSRVERESRAHPSRPSTQLCIKNPLSHQARTFSISVERSQNSDASSKERVSQSKQAVSEAPEGGSKPSDSTSKAVPQILKHLAPPVLHENIYTIPNLLTTTRIITAPMISYALLHSQPFWAFGLFAYSAITDLVDGYLARRYNSGTVLGSILDPFADKLLMTLTTISLYSIGTFPWWLALVILGRDGGLALSAFYFRYISLPPPRTMKRYWDFSLPSAEVRPTEISKINTLLQFLLVADAVLLPVLPVSLVETWNLWGIFEGWMGLVAGTTIWSGLSYVFSRDAIRFIGQDQGKSHNGNEQKS